MSKQKITLENKKGDYEWGEATSGFNATELRKWNNSDDRVKARSDLMKSTLKRLFEEALEDLRGKECEFPELQKEHDEYLGRFECDDRHHDEILKTFIATGFEILFFETVGEWLHEK